MSDHDPFDEIRAAVQRDVERIRSNERERIVKALEARRDQLIDQWKVEGSWAVIAFTEAIQIAKEAPS